ncbi:T9SS type A sorting domain-containing protein [Reichenbachiella carrageenanivorans]|uniref:T9SS type A sorting domain-containing protein n=1 Tax=Reichenbachiella carrageenanivorans TaxID=2979869 RepID=A0ABY6D410_9BACT|nr:T9SS type A sorting domain-containing protein [Reichenbachiella carrageenanivorans]UXX80843.1 T9SS type A sorting domain-containing protein [Reichenbachiella carrageenanivorans]
MKALLSFLLIVACHQTSATNPLISNMEVLGDALINGGNSTSLTAKYTFSNDDGATDLSEYQWYTSSSSDGSSGYSSISGATGSRYTIQPSDVNLYLFVEVTPKDDTPETGTPLKNSTGILASNTSFTNGGFNNTSITTNADYLNSTINNNKYLTVDGSGVVVTIHGDVTSNGATINVINNATLIISGQLILQNNLTLNVEPGSVLTIISGIDAKNNSTLDIDGDLNIDGDISLASGSNINVGSGGSIDIAGNANIKDGAITVDNGGSIHVEGDIDTGDATITGPGSVTSNGKCSGIACGDISLPIILKYFEATASDRMVTLNWATLIEINNDFFTLYKSTDGIGYTAIGEVAGAGFHQGVLEYTFVDNQRINGTTYYHLKQTDYDGKFKVFDPIRVSKQEQAGTYTAYPNPVTEQVTIISSESIVSLSVITLTGVVVYTTTHDGSSQAKIATDFLKRGVYLLEIDNPRGKHIEYLVKK